MILAAAATAAPVVKGVADAAKKVGEGLAGLFGDTPTDKARAATANQKLQQALAGDENALNYLLNRAFEVRPEDGKYPPRDVINLSRAALRKYYTATGIYPPAQYATKLGVTIPTGTIERVVQGVTAPVLTAIGTTAADAASERIGDQARAKAPAFVLVAVAGAIALAAVVYFAARSAK